jgi:hypothetical protein
MNFWFSGSDRDDVGEDSSILAYDAVNDWSKR